ncbi:hypothetical protein G7Z17_g7835 [Cylindrodendrum hubeiense]|uniref:Uncharacterized protein n=1 Tax=Cylindrodendrum hubeiense TaxID=595255 RepID=A0A9P5H2B3_9HYPO|nr:hypothetical protein G7Z17_g7835 [Cylindrodendrum hubeiense]
MHAATSLQQPTAAAHWLSAAPQQPGPTPHPPGQANCTDEAVISRPRWPSVPYTNPTIAIALLRVSQWVAHASSCDDQRGCESIRDTAQLGLGAGGASSSQRGGRVPLAVLVPACLD